MANDLGKVATVQANLATVPAQMATPVQFIEVIPIKVVIKRIGRDGIMNLPFVGMKVRLKLDK